LGVVAVFCVVVGVVALEGLGLAVFALGFACEGLTVFGLGFASGFAVFG
jgi:hypothetical protein